MPGARVILFYGLFFSLYAIINLYVFLGCRKALPLSRSVLRAYSLTFLVVASSFPVGRMLENLWISPISELLIWVGSFWFAAMLYLSLGFAGVDLFGLGYRWLLGKPLTPRVEQLVRSAIGAATLLAILGGYLNALAPQVRHLEISVFGAGQKESSLRIVVASDIHLGTIVGQSRLERIIKMIRELNPDLVLLPGDILDEDPQTVVQDNVGELLRSIPARYGVFAIMGNHEYIGGVEQACRYLEEHGITVLRDRTVRIGDLLYLVGREDRSITRFTGKLRKPLGRLLDEVDRGLPIILMDHQPFDLNEAVQNGVDLQVSGHTHHGQLWPLNLITSLLYEVSWGYLHKRKTHIYVSSGVGTWGPPVRIGNHPEIVEIHLTFSGKAPD